LGSLWTTQNIQSKAHVLCITDAHTKFEELEVVGNKEAKTDASAFFQNWICQSQIITDGKENHTDTPPV
jgi:hypothetical protein